MSDTIDLAEELIASMANTFYTNIALGRAKQHRKSRKVSVNAIAEHLDVLPVTVLRWENGDRSPNRWDAYRYMKALHDLAE